MTHDPSNTSLPNDANYTELTEKIRQWGLDLGLSIGFSQPQISLHHQNRLHDWLNQKYYGEMRFFEQNQALRLSPTLLQPGTLSIISARLNYWQDEDAFGALNDASRAYISRYALGRDYHKVMRQKLKQLCLRIEADIGTFLWRPFSDSAPIMEHAIAEQAGLGFIGKHTLLIHPEVGSTFFLGEILCNLPLVTETVPVKPSCGSCQKCLQDCPTQAIIAPYTVDARRCISYLTIEHPGSIDPNLRPLMGNRIYGCDDCQLTCPWNKFSQPSNTTDFTTRHQLNQISLLELWQWSESDFQQRFQGSPILRIGYERWRRNLAIAIGNMPQSEQAINTLEQAKTSASEMVIEHIEWALERQKHRLNHANTVLCKRSYL